MAKWESQDVVTQSVLDRLIDREPSVAADPPLTRAQSVRLLKASLMRDLEWLLNTRRIPHQENSSFQELERSVYTYGLPDITSLGTSSTRDRYRLLRMLEETIARFEPRLERVKVTPVETNLSNTRALRFQIEGYLKMDPAPEHISFDTVLQLSSGEYQVKGDQGA